VEPVQYRGRREKEVEVLAAIACIQIKDTGHVHVSYSGSYISEMINSIFEACVMMFADNMK
jgi:hypothetical protein